MKHSKDVISFSNDLASHYAKFDKCIKQYTIDLSDIPDFDLHAFAALLMAEDDSLASEANGPDNKEFDKSMMPALIRFMKNTTNRDEQIEYVKAWRDGVASYFNQIMQDLLDEAVYEMNSDDGLLYKDEPTFRDKPERDNNLWAQ